MKTNKTIILAIIIVIAIIGVLIASMGLTNNIENTNNINTNTPQLVSDLEEFDFDSYFKMMIPKDTSFEKSNGTTSGDISLYINYRDPSEKINVIYAEATGGKANLEQVYIDMAKDNANTTIKSINNATVLHFNNNTIGENDYHDLAIAGDDTRYVLLQCNNETLMNSMVESLKFS